MERVTKSFERQSIMQTFGARMEVLEHLGMRIVVDEAPSNDPMRNAG